MSHRRRTIGLAAILVVVLVAIVGVQFHVGQHVPLEVQAVDYDDGDKTTVTELRASADDLEIVSMQYLSTTDRSVLATARSDPQGTATTSVKQLDQLRRHDSYLVVGEDGKYLVTVTEANADNLIIAALWFIGVLVALILGGFVGRLLSQDDETEVPGAILGAVLWFIGNGLVITTMIPLP